MNKLILAVTALATLTSISTLPASAQSTRVPCTANYCGETGGGSSDTSCDEQLGHLPRVMKPEVAGVSDERRVWVTELCPAFSMMRSEGNAAYLRTTIAENDVLVDALGRKAYKPEDVFAVRMMGDDTITLYVHHFGR